MQTHLEASAKNGAVSSATLMQDGGHEQLDEAMQENCFEVRPPRLSRTYERAMDHIDSPLHD
jgi:hypothetical protein